MRANRFFPVLALLLLFFPARADESVPTAPPKDPAMKTPPAAATAKKTATGASSLTVARDPVTGALRPLTAEEAHQLLGGRRPLVAAEPQVVTLPNGTKMMHLGPDQAVYSVVRKNPDGTFTSACVHGAAEAEAFVGTAPRPTPAPAAQEK
jgi:hypothetical protein